MNTKQRAKSKDLLKATPAKADQSHSARVRRLRRSDMQQNAQPDQQSYSKPSPEEPVQKTKGGFRILTEQEVENARCKAYPYYM